MATNIAASAGLKVQGALNVKQSSSQLVRTSTGNLYVGLIRAANDRIQIYKSTNNGLSWSRQDFVHGPPGATTNMAIAIDGTDLIHIVYINTPISGQKVCYTTFDTTTDTFGIPEVAMPTLVNATAQTVAIAVDSNNKPHVAYGQSSTVDVFYANRVNGFWAPQIIVQAVSPTNCDIQIDNNNVPVIGYNSTTSARVAIGNKNDASSFTVRLVAAAAEGSANNASIVIDSSNNVWLAYQAFSSTYVMLAQHKQKDAWSTWQTAVTNGFYGKQVSAAIDGDQIYVFYERMLGGIAYDRYNITSGTWLGEQILQANTSTSTTNKAWHNPFVKWSNYFDNGLTGANNQSSNTIEYLFDDGATVYYDKLNTAQISTGFVQMYQSPAAGATTTSTSSTSSSTSTSISTSSTSSSTSISTSSTSSSTSRSTSTSSTSSSTSISTSTSISSTSSSISTSSTSSSISTSSTSSSTSRSTSTSSTSASTSQSTSISTSSTSNSTSISTSSTSNSTSVSSTSSSISTSSTSASTSVSTSSTSSSISTSSTSSSISTSTSSTSSSISTSSTSQSTSQSTSVSTSQSTSISSTSSSISTSTSSTSSSISTSSTSKSTSTSSTSTSRSTSTSSTSSSISTSSTSKSTSTSFSTSSTSASTSLSTTSLTTTTSTSSTSSSISSTSMSSSTSTTLIDVNTFPRAHIPPLVLRFKTRYERKVFK